MKKLTAKDRYLRAVRELMEPWNHHIPKNRPVNRRHARIEAIMARVDPDQVRQPTFMEIADYALGIAREIFPFLDSHPDRFWELFHWPPDVPLCGGPRSLFLPYVEECKEKAEKELRAHYLYYHVLDLRARRWQRAHPAPRPRPWTRLSVKRQIPTRRRRIWRPPHIPEYPPASSPPPATSTPEPFGRHGQAPTGLSPPSTAPPPRPPRSRPSWRAQEGRLRYPLLFDNQIAVLNGNDPYDAPPAIGPAGPWLLSPKIFVAAPVGMGILSRSSPTGAWLLGGARINIESPCWFGPYGECSPCIGPAGAMSF